MPENKNIVKLQNCFIERKESSHLLRLLTFLLFFSKVEQSALKTKTAILDGSVLPFDASGRHHLKDKFVVFVFLLNLFYTIYCLSSREK